ncbi:MAG TPA: hypothetical protein EYQ31_08795 [Candidatus Handelsmanbacteria bacterium]|nr:hypothetical protein [Candidatus Handelsmanbacteria bacterium]
MPDVSQLGRWTTKTPSCYQLAGQMQAVSLLPYGAVARDDKSVNAGDLRLEKLHRGDHHLS